MDPDMARRLAARPPDQSLARLFRDYAERWEIERVERGTEWVAVQRQARRGYICILGARDLGALRYKMDQADRDEAASDPDRPEAR